MHLKCWKIRWLIIRGKSMEIYRCDLDLRSAGLVRFPHLGGCREGLYKRLNCKWHKPLPAKTQSTAPLPKEGILNLNLHLMLSIEQITPRLTWHLRKEVLYPDETVNTMKMEE